MSSFILGDGRWKVFRVVCWLSSCKHWKSCSSVLLHLNGNADYSISGYVFLRCLGGGNSSKYSFPSEDHLSVTPFISSSEQAWEGHIWPYCLKMPNNTEHNFSASRRLLIVTCNALSLCSHDSLGQLPIHKEIPKTFWGISQNLSMVSSTRESMF